MAASAVLIGGVARAVEPVNQGGEPGVLGTATGYWTVYCRVMVSPQGYDATACTFTPGGLVQPGGAVTNYY